MPMVDAFIPEDALRPDAEARLMGDITDILLRHETGLSPTNDKAQAVSVVMLHRPAVFVAGKPARLPYYRFIPTVPEGQFAGEAVLESLVAEITQAVARAEGSAFDDIAPRVWVFPMEMPDGRWGGRGLIRRLPDIVRMLLGEAAGEEARGRLAARHRDQARALLRAAAEA